MKTSVELVFLIMTHVDTCEAVTRKIVELVKRRLKGNKKKRFAMLGVRWTPYHQTSPVSTQGALRLLHSLKVSQKLHLSIQSCLLLKNKKLLLRLLLMKPLWKF